MRMSNSPPTTPNMTSTELDFDYSFSTMRCSVCNKSLGKIGFYLDYKSDPDAEPIELYEELMIENAIHYEIRCDECMPPQAGMH